MMLRLVQTKRDRLEEKEAAIIEAATAVYLEKGLEKTTMAEIARRADVADGTLYVYFKNKNALMMAVSAAHWERITRGAQESIKGVTGFFEMIEAHAHYHFDMLLREWRLIDLSFALYYMHRSKETEATDYKRAYAAVFDMAYCRGLDRGEIRDDIPLSHARDLFYGTLEYAARTHVLHQHADEANSIVNNLMKVMREGLSFDKAGNPRSITLAAQTQLMNRLEQAVMRLEDFGEVEEES